MAYSSNKEIKKIIQQIESPRQNPGWRVESTRNGHFRALGPDGKLVHIQGTPSEYRGLRNLKSQLRRAGAVIN